MAQPSPYNRVTSFQTYQQQFPTSPLNGTNLDAELNAVKVTLDQVLNNVKLIQRDDGAVANKTIGVDQLKTELSIGFNAPAPWQPGISYNVNDSVFFGGFFYRAVVKHTSAAQFATDLAVVRWSLIADFTQLAGFFQSASITTQTIGTGPKSFAVDAGKFFAVNDYVSISADDTHYMLGRVTGYSATNLTVSIDTVIGAGTFSSWTVKFAGSAAVAQVFINAIRPDIVQAFTTGQKLQAQSNLGLVPNVDVQTHSADLDALAALNTIGLPVRTGVGAYSAINGAKGFIPFAQGTGAAPVFAPGEANVKAYGAVGNGIADDTTAVQAIINDTNFGTKYFPAGTYSLGHIDLVSGIKLKGDGAGKTIFKCRAAPATGTDWFYSNAQSNIAIEGITFDGNGNLTTLTSGHFPNVVPCIYVLGGHDILAQKCEFKGWDTTAFLTNTAYNVSVLDNIVDRGTPSAGHLTGGTSRTDGAITINTTAFTSPGATFTIADQNKIIQINGAGASGGVLTATILTFVNATSVTLNRPALTTVAGATFQYGGTQVSVTGIELSGTAIVDGNELRNFRVEGNRIQYGCIGVSGHDGVIARNLISGHSFGAGIHTQSLASNFNIVIADNVIVNGNPSQDTASAYPGGIENWAPNSVVANNTIFKACGPGMSIGGRTAVTGNACVSNGQANLFLTSLGGFAGIGMFAQDATYQPTGSFVNGNLCYDPQVSKTQQYGYLEHANILTWANDIFVGFNKFSGNLTADTLLQNITSRPGNMAGSVRIGAGGFLGGTHTDLTALSVVNTGNVGFSMSFLSTGTFTAARAFNVNLNDGDRTLSMVNNLTFGGAFTTAGGHSLTFTTTGATSLTLPTSGTLLPDGAWTAYTPTVTAQSGAFTTASGALRYRIIGKRLELAGTITITTAGTGAFPQFSLPVASTQPAAGIAQNQADGTMWTPAASVGTSTMVLRRYDNSGVVVNGTVIVVSLEYEIA